MGEGEENVRQRIKTEKAALKEKVEEIRRKMKEKEANQQRKESLLVVLKPVFCILLVILLVIGLFVYFSQEWVDSDMGNPLAEDTMDGLEEVEEIIAEDEE